jgi:hypothetical protein
MRPDECYFDVFIDEKLFGGFYQLLSYTFASVPPLNVEFGYLGLFIYSSVNDCAPAQTHEVATFLRDKDNVLAFDFFAYEYSTAFRNVFF